VYGSTLRTKGGDSVDEIDDNDLFIINNFATKVSCKHLLTRISKAEDKERVFDMKKIIESAKNWQTKLKEYKNWAGFINTADTGQLIQMPKFVQESVKSLKKLKHQLS